MNILDLFSGIGGFSLAAQRAGFEIGNHYSSEVDKYAKQIYRKQFPGAIQLGDVREIGNELKGIDIITGGFPCQSFSIAGKRRGFEDTRGTLFFEIERLARIYKPSYMVLENVKGIFSHDRGNTVRVILDRLRRLDYTVQLLLLNTADFNIPQNRERAFFICTLAGQRRPEISHIREAKRTYSQVSNCLDANYWKGIDNHGQRSCVAVGTLRTHKDGEGFREMQSNLCPTIPARAREDGSGQQIVSYKTTERIIKNINNEVAYTLTSTMYKGSASNGMTNIQQNSTIRRLTPIECERLQDFPDFWTEYGIDDNGQEVKISDTQRYKTLGNAITVRPAELIFKAIRRVF